MLDSIRRIKEWGAKAPEAARETLEPRPAPGGMQGHGPEEARLPGAPRRAFGDSSRPAGPGRGARIAAARPLIHLSGSATEAEAKLVLNRLAKNVPAPTLKALHEAGVKVVVERDSITERFPELEGTPNSWNPELTKDAGSGMYVTDLKELVIASKPAGSAARSGVRRLPGVQDGASVNVMLHELGHAVDFNVLGGTERNPLSHSGGFRAALGMDRKLGIPLPARSKIHDVVSDKYLHMGPAETFAEGYASFLTHPAEFEQAFPHLYGYFHSLSLDKASRLSKKGVEPRYGDDAAPSFATRRARGR